MKKQIPFTKSEFDAGLKPFTRSGLKVDYIGWYPAQLHYNFRGVLSNGETHSWQAGGRFSKEHEETELDLFTEIEVKDEIIEYWVNVYEKSYDILTYRSRLEADKNRRPGGRKAIHHITHNLTTGELTIEKVEI